MEPSFVRLVNTNVYQEHVDWDEQEPESRACGPCPPVSVQLDLAPKDVSSQ